jgi:hypothetical protein
MSEPLSAGELRTGDTTAQLQHDIDTGRTRDKAGGFDPAAAPLGTDEEAAGDPPSPELVALARREECARASGRGCASAATPAMAPDARLGPQPGLAIAAVAGLGAGVALAALVFAAL